jgi:hypothetical protein
MSGGAGGYIPPPGGYPSGPDTCANRTDCTPIVQSFNQPLPLLAPLYAMAATVGKTSRLVILHMNALVFSISLTVRWWH